MRTLTAHFPALSRTKRSCNRGMHVYTRYPVGLPNRRRPTGKSRYASSLDCEEPGHPTSQFHSRQLEQLISSPRDLMRLIQANSIPLVESPPLTPSDLVLERCALAREKLELGDYDAGCAALQPWWTIMA